MTRIAAIQMISTPVVADNIGVARRLVTQAARDGAGLVLLPEYWPILGRHENDKLAVADAQNQAQGIVAALKAEDIEVKSDREIVALIAYLQRLGTDIKVKPEQAASAAQ